MRRELAMTTIAVIGAGFSRTLLTLHLLRRCPPPTRLVLIERNSQFGRGLAYATGNASHILNVPAARMSAFHDRPNDFLEWLAMQPDLQGGSDNRQRGRVHLDFVKLEICLRPQDHARERAGDEDDCL